MKTLRRLSLVQAATAIMAGGLLLSPFAYTARASLTYCTTDPTVTLSNGVVVTLWANSSTAISNVSSVTYVFHVPVGVTLTSVSYDANGTLEHLHVVADQTGSHYEDNTTVYLKAGSASVSAYATRRDGTVASKNGTSGSPITLNWCT